MNTKGCVIYNMIELKNNHIIQEPKIKKISNMIGKVIGDYKVLEKLIINKRSCYKVQCCICGEIKYNYNITERYMKHNRTTCKETYCKSLIGRTFGDFTVIEAYHDKRAWVDLQCNICGNIRIGIAEKLLYKYKYKHDKTCAKLTQCEFENKEVANKLIKTFQNCKTRIRLGNEGDERHLEYKGLDFGFDNSVEFLKYTYPLFINALNEKQCDVKDLSIDRINTFKGYIKGNIRFSTKKEQNTNKALSYIYKINNREFTTQVELGEFIGVDQRVISREFIKNQTDEIKINNYVITRKLKYENYLK